jgi:iron(III) transport system permease protein
MIRHLKLGEPSALFWLAFAAALIALVAYPIAQLLLTSVQVGPNDAFGFGNFTAAFGRTRQIDSVLNTIAMGVAVVLVASVFAIPLAWAVSRTDMPARGFIRILVLSAYVMPPYLLAIAWILLAGPNAGWINRLWITMGGSGPLVNIFSFAGLVFIMAAHLFFLMFVLTSTALDLVSSEMEDAAGILGSGTWRTVRRITLPLVLPALLAGGILTFLQAIALFGVPALISLPARFPVMATQLWEFFEYPPRIGQAAAYSLPLLVITALLIGLQRQLLGRRGFTSVSGKGGERRIIRLGIWRWPMFLYALLVGTLTVFLPLLVILQAAFAKAWARGWSIDNFTLNNFHYVLFEHTAAQRGLMNSLLFGSASAIFALTLAFTAAYVIDRKLVPFGGFLNFLCTAPVVIPGIVLAIGFYAAYAAPPLALYGTPLLLILAFTTRFLPVAFANSAAALRSINPEMEQAVRILGGSRFTGIRRVMAPLLKRSLFGGLILVFVPASQELSTAIFLTGPNTTVVSVVLLNLSEEGNLEALAVLGSLLLAITTIIVGASWALLGRDFMVRGN